MRRRAGRRQRIFHAIGRVLFVGILLAAAVLALTIFFKVKTISVEGVTKYSAEEIVAGMDVRKGDNLYLWNKVKTSNALLQRFPYLQTVQIRRHLPDTLILTATECTASLAVPADGGYYLLSEQGKILEQRADAGGLPTVTGLSLLGLKPGEMLERTSDAYSDALLTVLKTLDAADMLGELDFINLQSLTDIRIGCQQQFDIHVGTVDELAYRLRFAQTVISGRLSPSDIGRLYWDAKGRLHFVPDTAENVARSATGLDGGAPVLSPGKTDEPQNGEDGQSAQPEETDAGQDGGDGDGFDGADDGSEDDGD